MTKAVIFDLDGTLLDTSALQAMREARDWRGCARNFSRSAVFAGINELIEALSGVGIAIGVCTSSPSNYAERILKHHGLGRHAALVCYHDASPRKPHPAPIFETLRRLKVGAGDTVAVGDLATDHQAHVAAGVRSFGAGWNPALEHAAGWHAVAAAPADVINLLQGNANKSPSSRAPGGRSK